MGTVAYKLELPTRGGIHDVFHVSQLKLRHIPSNITATLIHVVALMTRGVPEQILERKMVKRGRIAATKVLVKWKNVPIEQATWEFYQDLLQQFPEFQL